MKKLMLLALILATFCASAQTSDKPKKMAFAGYGGGMMLHTGFVQSKNFNLYSPNGALWQQMRLKGVPFGIGGAIRVRFGQHLRIGGEGYVSTIQQRKTKSYNSIGWGGLLADCCWIKNKWTFFVGGTLGGGSVKNLILTEAPAQDFLLENGTAAYRKYSFMAATPFLGFEYALMDRIHLIVKADYLFNISNPQTDFTTGPRLYAGITFCHWK